MRPPPEEHLRKGMYGAVLVPVSLFWFAFTTYTSVHWIVSMVRPPFLRKEPQFTRVESRRLQPFLSASGSCGASRLCLCILSTLSAL